MAPPHGSGDENVAGEPPPENALHLARGLDERLRVDHSLDARAHRVAAGALGADGTTDSWWRCVTRRDGWGARCGLDDSRGCASTGWPSAQSLRLRLRANRA